MIGRLFSDQEIMFNEWAMGSGGGFNFNVINEKMDLLELTLSTKTPAVKKAS